MELGSTYGFWGTYSGYDFNPSFGFACRLEYDLSRLGLENRFDSI